VESTDRKAIRVEFRNTSKVFRCNVLSWWDQSLKNKRRLP